MLGITRKKETAAAPIAPAKQARKQASEDAPVTRAEFDALVAIVGTVLAAADAAQRHTNLPHCRVGHQFECVDSDNMSAHERTVLNQVRKAFKAATEAAGIAERRTASTRSGFRSNLHYSPRSW